MRVLLWLAVILRPTDIAMGDHRGGSGWTRQGLPVQIMFENRFDTFIRARADADGPPTGRFEAFIAVVCAQPHAAQTRAEALLGMRPRGENSFDDLSGGLAVFAAQRMSRWGVHAA